MLTFNFLTQSVFAGTTTNYTVKARTAWSAFECAVLGSYDKSNQPENIRLFDLGYKEAKEFILAVKEKQLNDKNFDRGKIPLFYQFYIGASPSIDFHVGRMYEFIVDKTYKKISEEINSEKLSLDEKYRQDTASRIFWRKNCKLIGLE